MKRMKNTIILIVGLTIILTGVFMVYGTFYYRSIKINNISTKKFENTLKDKLKSQSSIDIKKCTDFEWDRAYVFPPYHSSNDVYKKVGKEWTNYNTYIGYLLFHDMENKTVSEGQRLIVFTKNDNVILSKIYNLIDLPVIFQVPDYSFTSTDSQFNVEGLAYSNDVKKLVLN